MLEQFLIYALQTAQTATTPAIAQSAPIDVNTLVASLTAIGGLAYAVMKKMSANMKNAKNESIKEAANMIETYILPALQQNSKFVEKTQVQDVKIEQLAEALYQYMGKDADKIKDKPEIQQKKLIADAAIAQKEKEEYDAKLKQVEDLKIKLGLVKPPPVIQQVVKPAPKTSPELQPANTITQNQPQNNDSTFVNTNPYA